MKRLETLIEHDNALKKNLKQKSVGESLYKFQKLQCLDDYIYIETLELQWFVEELPFDNIVVVKGKTIIPEESVSVDSWFLIPFFR